MAEAPSPIPPSQAEILLVTLNARYPHCAFGLRYLYANLAELKPRARILEFMIAQSPREIAERVLACNPRIVGFGVYIWNSSETQAVVSILKKVRPDLVIVAGGPEISHETEGQPLAPGGPAGVDYVIRGEADLLFYQFCRHYFAGGALPEDRVINTAGENLPEVSQIASPYSEYTEEDIRNRILYVEASRGCPYKCEYCLSSLDKSVRNFPLEPFLADMQRLIDRGARQFKFVDRTFNLSVPTSTRILKFFLERMEIGLFVHFEMVPDRLPAELRELIAKFPPGALQFEIGIQTFNAEVSRPISRKQDLGRLRDNFKFLKESTGVHTHADLIVGLPGETLESFARGFDELAALEPHEIQVGILKRLKGTPIIRHDTDFGMVYEDTQPFQILKTHAMPFETVQKMGRFAKFWDHIGNSGAFKATMVLIRERASSRAESGGGSLFREFFELSEFLSVKHGQTHSIALLNLTRSVWEYLAGLDADPEWRERVRAALVTDYAQGATTRDVPAFLRTDVRDQAPDPGLGKRLPRLAASGPERLPERLPERQKRHLSGQSPPNPPSLQ